MVWYAVHAGGTKGVYETWDECKLALHADSSSSSLHGTSAGPRPVFGKFESREEAQAFVVSGTRVDNKAHVELMVRTWAIVADPKISRPPPVQRFGWSASLFHSNHKRMEDDNAKSDDGPVLQGTVESDVVVRAVLTAAIRATSWAALHGKRGLTLWHSSPFVHGCIYRKWMQQWARKHWKLHCSAGTGRGGRERGERGGRGTRGGSSSGTAGAEAANSVAAILEHPDLVKKLHQMSQRVPLFSYCTSDNDKSKEREGEKEQDDDDDDEEQGDLAALF